MKKCCHCGETKEEIHFQKCKKTKDGLRNPCKVCLSIYNRAYYRKPENWAKKASYRRTEACKRSVDRSFKKHNIIHRDRFVARYTIRNAIRDGRVIPKPCEKCGTTQDIHAHHPDYSKPMEVQWLCQTHHREIHRKF